MSNISVEIGHIYQDMELNKDYGEYLKNSQNLIKDLNYKEKTLKLLIDDLNIEEKKWTETDLMLFLNNHDIDIDVIVFESKFQELAESYLTSLSNDIFKIEKFRRDKKKCVFIVKDNIKVKVKTIYESGKTEYSCALLSALWQLCRLGFYEYPINSYKLINEKKLIGVETLTIIEKKYEFVEKQVLNLVSLKLNNNVINHRFI